MRVCRIVNGFPAKEEILGGLGPNWYYYSRLSVERGIEVHVICGRDKGQSEMEEIDGVVVHRVSPVRGHRSTIYGDFAQKSIAKLREIKPDIIHGHNAYHIGAAMNKEKLGIPMITHLHGSIDLDLYTDKLPLSFDPVRAIRDRVIYRWSFIRNRYVTARADFVIACDQYTKRSVKRYFKDKRTKVVYNGVDPNHFKPVKTELKEKLGADKLLLFVGRPEPRKGVQYILEAMNELNERFGNLVCLMLGVKREGYHNVYYRWFKSIAERLHIRNAIFSQSVPYFELPKYYSAADCFICPSYPDPSPKVVYEAQSCSCPISAANGGGIPEIFGEESGLLFEPRNVEDLVEKTTVILNNPRRFKGGRRLIEKLATWEICVGNIIDCYQELWENN